MRNVLGHFTGGRRPAYTTVMTVMVRLHEKGLLRRIPKGNAYIYEPTFTREGFVEDASRKAVRDVLDRFGDVAKTQFLEEAGNFSEEQLQRLRELMEEGGQDEL